MKILLVNQNFTWKDYLSRYARLIKLPFEFIKFFNCMLNIKSMWWYNNHEQQKLVTLAISCRGVFLINQLSPDNQSVSIRTLKRINLCFTLINCVWSIWYLMFFYPKILPWCLVMPYKTDRVGPVNSWPSTD